MGYKSTICRALHVLENNKLSSYEKDKILTKYKLETPLNNYISPAWEIQNPTPEWVHGFVEAEGAFFITKKGKTSSGAARVVHSFGITQKLDPIVFQFLIKELNISCKAQYTKRGIYKLETTSSESMKKIKQFFKNKLKGMKGVEYDLWANSFDYKANSEYLLKVQDQIRTSKIPPYTMNK